MSLRCLWGYSALAAGAAITPFAVGSALSAALSGRYAVRHGRALITAGLLLMLAGFVGSVVAVEIVPHHATALATPRADPRRRDRGGLVIAPNQSLVLPGVPLPQGGAAGGLLQTGQRIGASIGIAAAGAAFFSTLRGRGTFLAAYLLQRRRRHLRNRSHGLAARLLRLVPGLAPERPQCLPGFESPDDPDVPVRDIPDRR